MLIGRDLSHHQNKKTFKSVLDDQSIGFIILKATEGKTYTDPTFNERARQVLDSGKLLGAYHYFRPENGNPVSEEWENFKASVETFRGRVRLFLDVEDKAVNYPLRAEEMLEYMRVFNETCGIYCSLSPANAQLKGVCKKYPVWLAHYNGDDTEGCVHYEGEIITQYSSEPIDTDVADVSVTKDTWLKHPKEDFPTSEKVEETLVLTEDEKEFILLMRRLLKRV